MWICTYNKKAGEMSHVKYTEWIILYESEIVLVLMKDKSCILFKGC